jgi:hypothetical protein
MKVSTLEISRFIGLVSIFTVSSLIPFHHFVVEWGVVKFYRELFFILFILLFIYELLVFGPIKFSKLRLDFFLFLFFPALVFLSIFYDPMTDIYGFGEGLGDITDISVDPRIYVFRNVIIYIPMVLYFYFRGITQEEIRSLALLISLIAPFAILSYLLFAFKEESFGLFLLGDMAESGGANIAYNSFVPYLAFPFLVGIYLLSGSSNKITKGMVIASIGIVAIFIFLSSSRQTLLFCALVIIGFLFSSSKKMGTQLAIFTISSLFIYAFFYTLTIDRTIDKDLMNKYSDAGKTSRIEIMTDGIERITLKGWFTGEGLTSVVNSGPHNDYIRWTQRLGLLFMIISFLPFFIGANVALKKIKFSTHQLEYLLIFWGLIFVIYNSIFGYPREDAYQAFFCFLAILLFFSFRPSSDSGSKSVRPKNMLHTEAFS